MKYRLFASKKLVGIKELVFFKGHKLRCLCRHRMQIHNKTKTGEKGKICLMESGVPIISVRKGQEQELLGKE